MTTKSTIARALLTGAAIAALSTHAAAKPNEQLTVAKDAPEAVKTAFAQWMKGESPSGRKDKCYGIALAGENDCAAGAGHELRGDLHRGLPGQRVDPLSEGELRAHRDP